MAPSFHSAKLFLATHSKQGQSPRQPAAAPGQLIDKPMRAFDYQGFHGDLQEAGRHGGFPCSGVSTYDSLLISGSLMISFSSSAMFKIWRS